MFSSTAVPGPSLSPSLEQIEKGLFGVPFHLIQTWINNPSSLDSDLISSLENNPDAQAKRKSIESADLEENVVVSEESPIVELPEEIAEVLLQRELSKNAKRSPVPTAGQILKIEQLVGSDGKQTEYLCEAPLAVLLVSPAEVDDVWWGFLVSSEIQYASFSDVLLELDDEPFDPSIAMVQTHNPVHIYLPCLGEVLGELSKGRLKAVHAVGKEHVLSGNWPYSADSQPGNLISREIANGVKVLTGMPFVDEDDPRRRYVDMYHKVADVVKKPAMLRADQG